MEVRAPDEQAAQLIALRNGDWTVDCRHGVGITVTARILHVSASRGLYVLAPLLVFLRPPGTACVCLFGADMLPGRMFNSNAMQLARARASFGFGFGSGSYLNF